LVFNEWRWFQVIKIIPGNKKFCKGKIVIKRFNPTFLKEDYYV